MMDTGKGMLVPDHQGAFFDNDAPTWVWHSMQGRAVFEIMLHGQLLDATRSQVTGANDRLQGRGARAKKF